MTMLHLLAAATLTSVAAPAPPVSQPQESLPVGTTRDQAIAKAEAHFHHLDADHSGFLTDAKLTAEFEKEAAQAGGKVKPEKLARMRAALADMDTDHDGKVTLAESKAAAGRRFDAIDPNKNGRIDASEAAPNSGGH